MEIEILRTETGYQLGKLHCSGFTPRESQALLLSAKGLPAKQCAQAMNCSENTFKDRIKNMFYKMDTHSQKELISKSFECGFLRYLSLVAAIYMGLINPDNTYTRHRLRVCHRLIRAEQRIA